MNSMPRAAVPEIAMRRETVGGLDLAHVATGDVVAGRLTVRHHNDAPDVAHGDHRGGVGRDGRRRARRAPTVRPGVLGVVEEGRPRVVLGTEERQAHAYWPPFWT